MDLKDFLKKVPIFSDFSEEELNKLLEIAKKKDFKKDTVIFQRDETGNFFFLICSGKIKVILETEEGREGILSILYPTEFFGEMSLLDGEPRSATVVALEDTSVLIINREDFLNLLYNYPQIALKILRTLSLRLRKANRQIETLMFLDAPGRIARVIIDIAMERGHSIEDGILIDLDFTRQELGNIVGISRETAIRVLKTFEDEGIIDIKKNHILIRDLSKLREKIY